jgi:hypothetical protein
MNKKSKNLHQKLGDYWLELLSEEEQTLFLENYKIITEKDKPLNNYLNSKFSTFEEFLMYAFIWDFSLEGHEYWFNLSKTIK